MTEAVALVGVVKFLSGYYVHVVTQARLLGMLGSHQVFAPTVRLPATAVVFVCSS